MATLDTIKYFVNDRKISFQRQNDQENLRLQWMPF